MNVNREIESARNLDGGLPDKIWVKVISVYMFLLLILFWHVSEAKLILFWMTAAVFDRGQ